jgi:eukaryotic-like serine/threonine-protein kinase
MSNVIRNLHDPEQAATNYAEALKIDERLLGPDDQLTLRDVNGVAAALFAGGRYAEAVQYFSRSRDGYQRLYGDSDVRTLHSQEGLALVEREAGLYAESKRDFEQILAALKEHPPQNNRFEIEVTGNYSMLLAELGDLDDAQSRAESVHEAFDKLLGATAGETIEAIGDLGYVHALNGQLESARQELQQAIDGKRKAHDDDVALELGWLADVERLRGDSTAAVALAQQARDVSVKLYGERSGQAARAHYALGLALVAAQRDGAEAELRASLKSFALIAPPDGMHPSSAGPRLALGKLLGARGEPRRADARALLRQALELRTATYGEGHPLTIEARTALAALSR